MKRKKWLIPVLIVLAVLLLAGTVSYAWFTSTQSSTSVKIRTEQIGKLEAKLYYAFDEDKDGVPEENPAHGETQATPPPAGGGDAYVQYETDTRYVEMRREMITTHTGYISNSYLSYRLIVRNPNEYSVDIELSFDEFDGYFRELALAVAAEDTAQREELIAEHSGMMMLSIQNVRCRFFTKSGADLLPLMVQDGENSVPYADSFTRTPDGTNLYALANGELFAEGITIPAGAYVVVDFQFFGITDILQMMSAYRAHREEQIAAYCADELQVMAFCRDLGDTVPENPSAEELSTMRTRAANCLRAAYQQEQSYLQITEEQIASRTFAFQFDYLYVTGTRSGGEAAS